MKGVFSSYRRRRRIMWGGLAAAVVGSAVAAGIIWPNTAPKREERFSNEPIEVVKEDTPIPLSAATKRATLETAAKFVQTAVRRERLGESYDLVAPTLRAGISRKEWLTGNIPVQYYPVDEARYQFDYSYPNLVGWQIAVWPRRGHKLRPMVFLLDLVPHGSGKTRRWLVSSWTPAGVDESAPSRADSGSSLNVASRAASGAESRIDARWVFAPLAMFAAVALALVGFAIRSRVRSARAERAYSSSSRPS